MAVSGRRVTRAAVAALVFLAVASLLLGAASLRHSHSGTSVGLWNEEHDLTLFALTRAASPLPPTVVMVIVLLVVSPVVLVDPRTPASPPAVHGESRAPPVGC